MVLKAERGGLAWGIAIPSILFGLVLAATSIRVGARTNGQVAELSRGYQEAPAEMVQSELPPMQKVNTNSRLTSFASGHSRQ